MYNQHQDVKNDPTLNPERLRGCKWAAEVSECVINPFSICKFNNEADRNNRLQRGDTSETCKDDSLGVWLQEQDET